MALYAFAIALLFLPIKVSFQIGSVRSITVGSDAVWSSATNLSVNL